MSNYCNCTWKKERLPLCSFIWQLIRSLHDSSAVGSDIPTNCDVTHCCWCGWSDTRNICVWPILPSTDVPRRESIISITLGSPESNHAKLCSASSNATTSYANSFSKRMIEMSPAIAKALERRSMWRHNRLDRFHLLTKYMIRVAWHPLHDREQGSLNRASDTRTKATTTQVSE